MLRKRVTNFVISVMIYFVTSLLIMIVMFSAIVIKDNKIKDLEKSHNVVYTPDNKGSVYNYVGYVIDKSEEYNGTYSISVVGYGKFMVSKVEYYEIQTGKKCPDFILKRGQNVTRKAV